MKKNILFLFITFIISLTLIELGFYLISFFIPTDYYYTPVTANQFTEYLSENLDRRLGWNYADNEEEFQEGYRRAPAGKNLPDPCISLYGDSFTVASGVSSEEAWGNVLIPFIGCRVDNYGVSGYGTDQSYLRFLYNKTDKAKIIILCHLSENIVRNINQNRPFIYGQGILLKPRFLTDDRNNLTLVPIINLTPDDYCAFSLKPERFLLHDFLIPETSGLTKRRLGFPYCYRVPYMLTYKRIYMSLVSMWFDSVPPWFSELYDPGHPSKAYQVTKGIMLNFVKECNIRGKVPIIFIIPTIRDLKYYKKTGKWVYSGLVESLINEGINIYNLGPPILKKTPSDDLPRYFSTRKNTVSGHYTPEGNRILAEVVAEILTRNPDFKLNSPMPKQ